MLPITFEISYDHMRLPAYDVKSRNAFGIPAFLLMVLTCNIRARDGDDNADGNDNNPVPHVQSCSC